MLPVIDTPVLHYLAEEVASSGIEDVYIVISPAKTAIADYFAPDARLNAALTAAGRTDMLAVVNRDFGVRIHTVIQSTAKGSGDALLLCEKQTAGEPFAVLLGDDLINAAVPVTRQLIDAYAVCGRSVVGMQARTEPDIRKYGVADAAVKTDAPFILNGILEKPAQEDYPVLPSVQCALGRYVFTPDIFAALRATAPVRGELGLTYAIQTLCTMPAGAAGYVFSGRRYDMGDKYETIEAIVEYALARPEFADKLRAYLAKIR
jgi:UTP--glucose-1-phosphate uridylyltransferase